MWSNLAIKVWSPLDKTKRTPSGANGSDKLGRAESKKKIKEGAPKASSRDSESPRKKMRGKNYICIKMCVQYVSTPREVWVRLRRAETYKFMNTDETASEKVAI